MIRNFIAALSLATLLVGCDEHVIPKAKFHYSQEVVTKLGNKHGMILDTRCYTDEPVCFYKIRFLANESTTDTHVLGSDGPIDVSPFSIVTMREFELQPAQ